MHINKIKVKNFKKIEDGAFDFNKDVNILVGDNDSGKSTILEALEIALNCCYRGKSLAGVLSSEIFNSNALIKYLKSNKEIDDLPEILIEAYIDGIPEYKGSNNSEDEDCQGVFVKVILDEELIPAYEDFIKDNKEISSIPIEFYKIDWYDFAWNRVKGLNRKFRALVVDPIRMHPTYGKNQYISNILNASLEKDKQAVLGIQYRQLKESFNKNEKVISINEMLDKDKDISLKKLEIVADISGVSSIESNFQLAVDQVIFPFIGKGEQHKIQIKLAIQNKSKNVDVILVEEPENHLSHMNLTSLINYIESKRGDKQLFLTTHSSYVMNKLSINKLCLLADKYKKLDKIDPAVVKNLKRLPGYDTLRSVLSSKVILVEGPSDELVLKRYYIDNYKSLPEENGIDIIVVRGIGFKNYLEIVKHLGIKTKVVKDNDGSYVKNIKTYEDLYKDYPSIKVLSHADDELYSLEPVLIDANSKDINSIDCYAKIILSTATYNNYKKNKLLPQKKEFLRKWYLDKDGAGKKKVDSAIRIFDSESSIHYPDFIKKVFDFE
ncbi:chromosome segregation protein [Yersinia enterocolitica]|uniref:Chromosome segregation protein n=1 Tax=Yersinia enterocolitica TaxID=630 RepID=A0A9P1PWA0_YEREN|nr:AAA family ATPase [Yersinia enterocolitica]CNF88089.1 chromosome segregation protein [Yersinia enterocolitica]